MSAALLRKLVLDQGRLMDQVNRSHRLDLRFRISSISPLEQLLYDDNPMFWSIEDGLDPESPFAYAPFEATRDQFLARRVMRFGGSWIKVRDVIDQLANIEGAVHSGKAKDERQRALQAAANFYSRTGLPGAVSLVRLHRTDHRARPEPASRYCRRRWRCHVGFGQARRVCQAAIG